MRRGQGQSPPPAAGEAGLPDGRTGGGEVEAAGALLRQRARSLRKSATDAERALWARLRRRQVLGRKFRRQQPLGRYIVDFVCFEERLIVEVDGGQHLEQQCSDGERQRWLEAQGYRLLRFWNDEVLSRPSLVVEAIARAIEGRSP